MASSLRISATPAWSVDFVSMGDAAMPAMLRPEVRDFVRACEMIQGLLARHEELTQDEIEIIRVSASDLLFNMRQAR